eukprot:13373482-Ditylum_brightwellii.AAC.1
MEEWCMAFDAEQKKHFCEQEKKISKKINTKLSNLSSAMEDKLNSHQVENNKNNELTTAHGNQIVLLQDFTQKKNRKRQKHGANDNNLD